MVPVATQTQQCGRKHHKYYGAERRKFI